MKRLNNITNIICVECGKEKQKIRTSKFYLDKRGIRNYIFIDENGEKIEGKYCVKCRYKRRNMRNYELGIQKPIDEVTHPSIAKGRKSERIVETWFKNLGYRVELTKVKGPDLICYSSGKPPFTVEVKTSYKILNQNTWRVHSVLKNRRKDNFLAIVLPDNKIHIESMSSHLEKCSPCGERTITNLVREVCHAA